MTATWPVSASSAGLSETIDDRVNALLMAGAGVTLSYDDSANTLTITATGVEEAQDAVGSSLADTDTVVFDYDDASNVITAIVPAGSISDTHIASGAAIALSKLATNPLARASHTGTQTASTVSDFSEAVDDRVNALLAAGAGVTLTYDDTANTLTIASTGTAYTDEQAVDAVDLALTDSPTVSFAYNDGLNEITAIVVAGSIGATQVASSLKPSGTAAGTDESLRRLGTGSTHAAAGDDSRFPSTGEKNALVGSSGTPGSGNKYVTDADSRLSSSGIPASLLDAKGDLIAASAADTAARLAAGSNYSELVADSAQATGLRWRADTWVNVKDYGALGDESTDDTAAIQAALTAAGVGGNVWFPKGKYKVSDQGSGFCLDISTFYGITLAGASSALANPSGEGWGSCIFTTSTSTTIIKCNAAVINFRGPHLLDLRIESRSASANGMSLVDFNHYVFERCSFRGNGGSATSTGLYIYGVEDASYGRIEGCHFHRHLVGCQTINSVGATFGGSCYFDSSVTNHILLDLQGASSVVVMGTKFQCNAASGAIAIRNGVPGGTGGGDIQIVGNNFEQCTTGVDLLARSSASTTSTQIHANQFVGSGVETAIKVGTNRINDQLIGNRYVGLATNVSDSGTDTLIIGGRIGSAQTGEHMKLSGVYVGAGTAAPTASVPDGSIYLQKDVGVKKSVGGVWSALGGGTASWLNSVATYSSSITPNVTNVSLYRISPTNTTAFTINAPTGMVDGQVVTFSISNASGGTIGNITWDAAFKTKWSNSLHKPTGTDRTTLAFAYNAAIPGWVQAGPIAVNIATTETAASGSVATDAIWDTKGDIAAATAADTATKLAAGANNTVLVADSGEATGLKYAQIADAQVSASAAIAKTKLASLAIVNADVDAGAAIAKSKLASLAIVNADVDSGAAIAYGKLALTNAVVNADIASAAAIAYSKLALTGALVNADVNASAAIAYSKLNLSASIVNADVASGAAIAYSKLALTGTILNADLAGSIAISKLSITGTPDGSKFLRDDGSWQATGGGGAVATDVIWDTKGDIAAATAADTATKLAAGANDTVLVADSAQATGLKYAKVANAQIDASAAIAKSKLAALAIVDADVDAAAAIAKSKLAALAIVNADVDAAAAIAESKLNLASDAAAGTASRRTLGTSATSAAAGNDSRLSDSRTPTAHQSTHALGGADAVTPLSIGAMYSRWKPTGAKVETFPRNLANTSAVPTSGILALSALAEPLRAGVVYTSISFFSTTTLALGTSPHIWFTLVNLADSKTLRTTADDTAGAWAANTVKTLNLSSTYTPSVDVDAYIGVMIAFASGGTMPTIVRATTTTVMAVLAPALGGPSSTGQTTPPADATTMTTPTGGASLAWGYVS